MQLIKLHEIAYNTEETILAACVVNADEWVMLLSDGDVIRYKTNLGSGKFLFNTKKQERSADGGWEIDLSAPVTLRAIGNIVVLVNDYKSFGYVSNPLRNRSFKLFREDYHADNSKFPVLLYNDGAGLPHLIYSTAWNELHILNCTTLQVLTVAKSLIEENAEERHLDFLKQNPDEDTNTPWPAPFDYFYGELLLSPNGRKFLSKGWVWGSRDHFLVFDIDDFTRNNRIAYQHIGNWEHYNRSACWVDDNTVALTFNAAEEDTEGFIQKAATEIHIYDLRPGEPLLMRRLVIDCVEETTGNLFYSKKHNAFVVFSKSKGTTFVTPDGHTIFRDGDFRPDYYYPQSELFLTIERKMISVHSA